MCIRDRYNSMIGPSQRMLRLKLHSNINFGGKPSALSPSDMNKHLNSSLSFNNSNYGRISSLNNSMAVNKLKAHQNKNLNSPYSICQHTKMADFKYSAPVHHDPNEYLKKNKILCISWSIPK